MIRLCPFLGLALTFAPAVAPAQLTENFDDYANGSSIVE
jgi:hypothetical protein